jgi:hypothetical protein
MSNFMLWVIRAALLLAGAYAEVRLIVHAADEGYWWSLLGMAGTFLLCTALIWASFRYERRIRL